MTASRSWVPNYSDSRVTRRRFLQGTAAGLGAAALIACGGGGTQTTFDTSGSYREPGTVWSAKNDWTVATETKQAVRGGIYRGFRAVDQEGHYNAISLQPNQTPFSDHVHEMLMARNSGPGIDPGSLEAGVPVGMLAESWEIAPDGLTVTYTLRPNVKFHPVAPVNGRVMDTDDWKTSHELYLKTGTYRGELGGVVSSIEFPDARHMVWKLPAPYGPLLERIWATTFTYQIQPKELNVNPALAETKAIGTGYKILDKHQPSIAMEYRKFPEYWGGDPFIERWHVPIIPEYSNQYSQFLSGNIIDFTPTARDILLLHKDAPNAVVVAEPISDEGARRLRWGRQNPAQQPWADPRVRIAARRSIDFKSISEFLSNKVELERSGIPVELLCETVLGHHPGFWLDPEKGELGKASENFLYSPVEAKKLTAAAGYPDPIPLFFPVQLSSGEFTEGDRLVIDSFAAAGTFKLNIERVPTRAEFNKYVTEGVFDGLMGTDSGGSGPDYLVMRDLHSEGRVGSAGLQNQAYTDPRMDALGEAQRRELDVEKRYQILKEVQILAGELMFTVPSRHSFTTFGFRWPWLRNFNYGSGGTPPSGKPALGGHLQWLDADMPNRG